MKLTGMMWALRLTAMTISGFFISMGLFVLCSPLLLVFFIYSKFIYCLMKLKHGKNFLKADGLDIIQGFQSSQSMPYINAIGRYKGKIDIPKFKVKFTEFILNLENENGKLKFRKFRQVFEKLYGYHVFRDDENFDLDNHFKKVPLKELFPELYPKKNNNEFSSKEVPIIQSPYGNLSVNMNGFHSTDMYTKDYIEEETEEGHVPEVCWEEVINRLMNKYGSAPLPPGIPQWQILYVEEQGYTTLVFKLNHAYSDGVYILRFYLEHLGDFPVKCNLPYNYHQPQLSKKLMNLFWAFCLLPFGLSRLSFKYEKNTLHGPELSGDKMYMISKSISLVDLKAVKKDSKTSMNAILFTCMSNAIASHFQMKKCDVENVIVLIPVSLQDLSRPIKLRNQFGIKGILLPTFVDKSSSHPDARKPRSALRRLREVQASCDRTKSDPSFLAIHWLLVFICSLLPSKLLDNVFTTRGLTTSLSNLAGPTKEGFQIMGCKKSEFCFFIPDRSPLGMGVSIAGFNDRIRVGLMIDRALMASDEEGHQFLEAFNQEVINLNNELKSKQGRKTIMAEEEYTSLMVQDMP